MKPTENRAEAMSPSEETFYQQLGLRIAGLRKKRGLTQVQLAERLGISQQHLLSFEKGRRRVPVSALPTLADLFGISLEELLLGDVESKPGKRGPAPKLQRQLEQLSELPRSQQQFVSRMIDTVLQQAGR